MSIFEEGDLKELSLEFTYSDRSTPVQIVSSIGNWKNACSLFDDASDRDLALIDSVISNRGVSKPQSTSPPPVSSPPRSCNNSWETDPVVPSKLSSLEPVPSSSVISPSPELAPPSVSLQNEASPRIPPSFPCPLEDVAPPPLFSEADFPPLTNTGPSTLETPPLSPTDSPSFKDPSLQKTLNIFSDKTPLSPSVLPLDSIRFENVTIRRKKKSTKPPFDSLDLSPAPYTPLSMRLKATDGTSSSPPPRVLRASTPHLTDS